MSTSRNLAEFSDEENFQWSMAEYKELSKVDEDGVDFIGKTALWIAYERALESSKPEGERLFNDTVAKHITGCGKRLSEAMGCGMKSFFDPKGDIGHGYNGHISWTAVRTRLINDYVTKWLDSTKGKKQVLNLGAGLDTRAFWFESLKSADCYIEVDTKPITDLKNKNFDKLKKEGKLPTPFCERKVIAMDFSKERTKDLSNYGVNKTIPICWILEGLVMYLTKEDNTKLLQDLSELSCSGSYAIINFLASREASAPAHLNDIMKSQGWVEEKTTFFGDKDLNYGRYPQGKPASESFGFTFYLKK